MPVAPPRARRPWTARPRARGGGAGWRSSAVSCLSGHARERRPH
jgi:hypothetical protein